MVNTLKRQAQSIFPNPNKKGIPEPYTTILPIQAKVQAGIEFRSEFLSKVIFFTETRSVAGCPPDDGGFVSCREGRAPMSLWRPQLNSRASDEWSGGSSSSREPSWLGKSIMWRKVSQSGLVARAKLRLVPRSSERAWTTGKQQMKGWSDAHLSLVSMPVQRRTTSSIGFQVSASVVY